MYLFSTQRLRREMLASRAMIAATEEEIRRLEAAVGAGDDPLTGTWRVVMEPGGQQGLMFLRLDGTLVQGTYRVGDSVTNVISPLMSYFPLVVAFMKRYDDKAGIGTVVATMLPYSVAFFIVWTFLLIVWFLFGIPMGPGSPLMLGN